MTSPLKLEVFETPQAPEVPLVLMPDEIEEIRLNSYERGYVAGWDDSANQDAKDDGARRIAIERQVEQLTFSYHEARGHVLKSIEPLLESILDSIVPAAVRACVVPQVLEQLLPLAHAASEKPLILNVSIGAKEAFLQAFEGQVLPPIEIVETAELPEGAASFASGNLETRIDLAHVAQALEASVRKFYQLAEEESRSA